MSDLNDPVTLYSDLSKVGIPPEKGYEIWQEVERASKSEQTGKYRRPLLKRLGPTGAACAAVLILVFGGYVIRQPSSHVSSNMPVTQGNGNHAIQPAEVTSGDWTLAIYKTLLKQGPYYEMVPFYVGKKPIAIDQLKTSWGGATSGGVGSGTPPLQPGTSDGGMSMVQLPDGLAKAPPLVLYWSSQDGQSGTVKFILSQAQSNLEVINAHEYSGHDSQWTVQYAYETIKGKGFSYPYGILTVKYSGKQVGSLVSCAFQSPAGKQQINEYNVQGNSIRINIDPSLKGNNITSPKAYITITSKGVSDRITLTKQSL